MKGTKFRYIFGISTSVVILLLLVLTGIWLFTTQLREATPENTLTSETEETELDETVSEQPEEEVKEEESTTEDEVAEEKTEIKIEETQKQPEKEVATEIYVPRKQRNLSEFINLQSVVDRWVANHRFREAAVEIFDVDFGKVAASYNANSSMYPRSLYKLFYVYDAYTQIDAGKDDPNQIYLNGQTLGRCLDIIVRQSDNACAEAMLNDTPRLERVGQLIIELGPTNTISTGLKTSAHDISLLLQHYYLHPEWSASSWQSFRSSALSQAWTFRKGLPSGFSTAVVYDKAGWTFGGGGYDVYNDAALVEFPLGNGYVRRYIIVAMTSYPASYTILTDLGTMLENAILYE